MREQQRRPDGLTVTDLNFQFGNRRVLDHVTLTVAPGEFKVLLGPNGAGKTTLFSLLTRLFSAPAGKISVSGFDLARQSRSALSGMGVVFQQPTLDLDLSVAQNLYYHAALHGLSRAHAKQQAEHELTRLHMADRLGDKVRSLNGGHRRRVEIARALMHQPDILLLDEPTVGLDPESREEIIQHVHSLSKLTGVSVLWATHLVDEVRDGDSVIILDRGQVKADGRLAEILQSGDYADIKHAFFSLTGNGEPFGRGI